MIPYFRPKPLIYIPYARVNCLKTIPFTAAHTYIAHIWKNPPPPAGVPALAIMPPAAKNLAVTIHWMIHYPDPLDTECKGVIKSIEIYSV